MTNESLSFFLLFKVCHLPSFKKIYHPFALFVLLYLGATLMYPFVYSHIFSLGLGLLGPKLTVRVLGSLHVELSFNDLNSSANGIPEGYRVQFINGFVEELVMNDDPEYQWIDKIRTPRASNEARQILFLKLSGIIQRKIGLKALELGGNAVLG